MKAFAVPSRTNISARGVFDVQTGCPPSVPVRYVVGDFIKLPIKAVRADYPLLCLLKGFIVTASNYSAPAVILFQPRPPCQEQRILPVIGRVVVFLSVSLHVRVQTEAR